MPSLHAALPMLLALVLVRVWGRWMMPTLLYPLTMSINLVYLGEHWVIDVLAGIALALVAYALIWVLPEALPWRPALHLSRRGHDVAIVDSLVRRAWDLELGVGSLTPIRTLDERVGDDRAGIRHR